MTCRSEIREENGMTRVLITGAAGHIGKVLRQGLRGRYNLLRLSDKDPIADRAPGEEIVQADVQDFAAMHASMQGIDCVVHLGALPVEHPWEQILPVNIAGTYNIFEAARQQGVKRVVFASSNHAIGFYRRTERIDHTAQPRPDSRYGLSKAFGEALGHLYADKHDLSVISLRIGTCKERPTERRHLSTWLSHRDTIQLVQRCIDAPLVHCLVVYGVSNNPRSWWDNTAAMQQLGYVPEDSAEEFAAELLGKDEPKDEVNGLFHGGPFCSAEFDGDAAVVE
jgi:uronate dehydrogenase